MSNANVGPNGGVLTHKKLALNTTNSTLVKGSQSCVYSIIVSNMTASAKFLKLYDKVTAPTVGTDTIKATIPVQPNNTLVIDFDTGISFTSGLGYGMTGAIGDSDTTALAANDMVLTLNYI